MSNTPHQLAEEFPEYVGKIRHLREADGHFRRLAEAYDAVMMHRRNWFNAVTKQVGGVVENRTLAGPGRGQQFSRVPVEKQKAAVKFLVEQCFTTPKELLNPEVVNQIKFSGVASDVMGQQRSVLASLLSAGRLNRLLDAEVILRCGDRIVDHVKSYTALRSFHINRDRLLLNGRPYPLRLVLDQGYWNESFMTAPSDEHLKRDVELAKLMGFNGVRKHQKIEDPRYLYWADKLGLLVWEEMPSAYRFAPRAITRMVKEWTEAIERDYSHPCIIVWVPFNESWGVPNLTLTQAHRNAVEALYHLTRTLDATRPVIGNDGWEASATDILGIHDYDCNPDKLKARYEVSDPVRTLFDQRRPGGRILTLDGFPHRGQPIVLTEFGGIAFDPNATPEDGTWGYTRAHTAESYHALYRDLLKVVNETFMFSGFCYTQFADTFQEANGLLNADRTPKLPFELISAATRNVTLEPKDVEEEGDKPGPA